jgi:uncharacterized protein YjiS (DUF1127 family)
MAFSRIPEDDCGIHSAFMGAGAYAASSTGRNANPMKGPTMNSLIASLLRRSANRRTYASLMALDDRLLADIGLTRTDLKQMMAGSRTAHAGKFRTHE